MQNRQVNKPSKINQDKDPKYLTAEEASYMLNSETSPDAGGNASSGESSLLPANEFLCDFEVAGNPVYNGSFRSELTNEVYAWYYNSAGNVFIVRVNGDKTCQLVWQGDNDCAGLSAEPKHSIEQWKVYLKYDKFCAHQGGKQLIWTNGVGDIHQIDVEASIVTNSFTTAFFNICRDECAYLKMCVPETCDAPEAEFIPFSPADIDLNNTLTDMAFQLRYRHIYYDRRANEWSDISKLYFQDVRGCFDTEEGLSRCVKFTLPLGNPLVEKIEVAYRINNDPQWLLADTIDKYKPYTSESQMWFQRELAVLDDLNTTNCTFSYTFCNDKQCTTIDVNETNRLMNPIPRDAQGLFRVKDALAFYNYVKGNCPLVESEIKKFKIGLACPTTDCVPEMVEVKVYAVIHRFNDNENEPIYRFGGKTMDEEDNLSETAYFGGISTSDTLLGTKKKDKYDQFFKGDVRNFIPYIEGTDYFSEMEQWRADEGFISKEKVGVISGLESAPIVTRFIISRINGTFYYQEAIFKVPKGTKGFIRLAGHKALNGAGNNQKTSTFVYGTIPDIRNYKGLIDISVSANKDINEIYFDACDGNVELLETFVVIDMATAADNGSSSYSGYVTDNANAPVEGAEIWSVGTLRNVTDHNGFYHLWNSPGTTTPIIVEVRVEQAPGAFTVIKTVNISNDYNHAKKNIKIEDEPYRLGYYHNVNVAIKDCNNIPVGGVTVALSGSKAAISAAVSGVANFRIRNYGTRNRTVKAVVMNGGGCFSVNCLGQCNPCMPASLPVLMPAIFEPLPPTTILTGALLNIDLSSVGKKGLKAGGRYPFGLVAQGSCGRLSSVYPVTIFVGGQTMKDNFLNIPKTQEKGSLSFCDISYNGTGLILPDWADCVKVVRGANVNPYELQWVVDKIERKGDGKIALTIQSLNDYNTSYNFTNNTIYQYVKDDRVEFISNGDGKIFGSAAFGILNYQILSPFHDVIASGNNNPPADFFNQILIQDNGSLDNLTEGAKIELQRPKECSEENISYFGIGVSLDLVLNPQGKKVLAVPIGVFETYDTYIVNRQINGQGVQQFEHRNPSDFWGDRLFGVSDIGKAYFVNRYENEKRYGRNISLNAVGQFNRFGDLEKVLDAPEQGDLVSVFVYDGKIGLGIGERDNFLFQVSDEFLRVGNDGVVRAAPPDALISDTEPKVAGKYGCQYAHAGSVYFGDGFVVWADVSKGAYVLHDFNSASDISDGEMSVYFRKKWNGMELANVAAIGLNKFRFVTGFNFHTKRVMLTMKRLNGADVNNSKAELILENETIIIDPLKKQFKTFASFTPVGYANIDLSDGKGCAFLAFNKKGIYIHPVLTNVFNRFFEMAVDRVITIALNQEPDIIKQLLSFEIQDEKSWFVSKVSVANPSYDSEIPASKVKKKENKWNGHFLNNKNGPGGLHGIGVVANRPRGYYVLVTFVRDNTDDLKYNTIDNTKRISYSSLDMILFKYAYSAQSGFRDNL